MPKRYSEEQNQLISEWTPWLQNELRQGRKHIKLPYRFFSGLKSKRGESLDGDHPAYLNVLEAMRQNVSAEFPHVTVYPALGKCDIQNEPPQPESWMNRPYSTHNLQGLSCQLKGCLVLMCLPLICAVIQLLMRIKP